MLLMALPNEHLLIFSQYNDDKTLFEAIQARFGSNDATKKTQRTLMKQMYENFNAPSTESLDSVFNRNQPNGSQLVHEDLEQIHEDDLEEMDLKWQLALLSMRARRYFQKTGKKITINGSDIAGLRNQDSSRKTVIVEDTSSKAMVSIDSAGFDWSYMADDEVPTNMALMAFSDLEHPKFKGYGPKASKNVSVDTSNEIKKAPDALIIKDWVSDSDEDESEELVLKSNNVQHKHKQANQPRNEHDKAYVAFGGGAKDGKITGKGTIRTGKLDFKDVYFVKELQFNLFSVSRMCDKKNNVLFTDTECFVLSPNFKLADESQDLLKVPKKNNMYRFDMKNIVSQKDLTCLLAKATNDESMLWHRRLSHTTKDETSRILKSFITEIENLVEKKVKIIRCDNETEFKNKVMNEFCKEKGIKREYSMAKTPQQNEVAERRNRTLIEAVRTMVLVVKPHFKTHYELFKGRTPILSFMRPFRCHVTILNTLDHLGKFDGKSDEGIFVGYYTTSKAFRVYNIRTRKVEENLHITFLENKPIIAGKGTSFDAGQSSMKTGSSQDYILMPLWKDNSLFDFSSQASYGHNKDKMLESLMMLKIRDEGAEADYINLETVIPFKLLNVWTRVYLPLGKRDIGTKWVYRNKRDQRGIVVKNKARLVAQGHRQEEGIDYDEVFAHVARIKAISQPSGFVDLEFPDRVYKVEKALYSLHQALKPGLQVEQRKDGTFLSQDKYVSEILKKFGFSSVKPASTPMETHKPLSKDAAGTDTNLLQCKKQTIMADSTTEAEYIATSNYCGQVFWLQNQLLDYDYNFMQTKIYVDNESAICVVKNHVYHSKTKHIEIRHHFIRDSYEKRLIKMVKIHTDYNVADLLTKAFDVTRFQFLVASIGLLNP
nr:hypothetical protein [Tanacetum cinerariifolium]